MAIGIACLALSACGGGANAQGAETSQSGQSTSTTVTPITVEDGAGHVVGPYIQFTLPIAGANIEGVFIRTAAASFAVQANNQGFVSGGTLLYTTSDCTGTAYVETGSGTETILMPLAIILNDTAYVFQWSATTTVSVASETTPTVTCSPLSSPGPTSVAPVVATVGLSTLGFVAPFSVH
jgi:hypothetical protein